MISVLLAVLLAIVVYWLCAAAGLPVVIGAVAALLVLVVGLGGGRTWGRW